MNLLQVGTMEKMKIITYVVFAYVNVNTSKMVTRDEWFRAFQRHE
jgi:hypothetical protein